MIETKLFELRDSGTFIPMMGVALSCEEIWDHRKSQDDWLIRRAGYGDRCIMFGRLDGGKFSYDCFSYGANDRTYSTPHRYVIDNWDTLKSGDVICVEFILGERETPKVSERLDSGF